MLKVTNDVEATIFKQLVGSLRYLCNTRPDICYAVGMVSRLMNKPKWSYYQVAVRILRYIKETLKYGALFPSSTKSDSELICFSLHSHIYPHKLKYYLHN